MMIFLLITVSSAFFFAFRIRHRTQVYKKSHQSEIGMLTKLIETKRKDYELSLASLDISSTSLNEMKISTQKIGHLVLDLQKIMLNLVAKHK